MPTHAFGEAIIKTSKFKPYSNSIKITHILVHCNFLENLHLPRPSEACINPGMPQAPKIGVWMT
jgi:hypothetical protein